MEKRPTREKFDSPYNSTNGLDLTHDPGPEAIRDEAAVTTLKMDAPPEQSGVFLSDLTIHREPRKGGQTRPTVRLTNSESESKELLLIGTVTRPDGSKREIRTSSMILKPGDAREVVLPPVDFKSGSGIYELDLTVWEGDKVRSRLSMPKRIEIK